MFAIEDSTTQKPVIPLALSLERTEMAGLFLHSVVWRAGHGARSLRPACPAGTEGPWQEFESDSSHGHKEEGRSRETQLQQTHA
jgi:hypothetical protein